MCVIKSCGDGVLDNGEQCDDNHTLSNDGCTFNCLKENCTNLNTERRRALNGTEICINTSCGNGTLDFGE